MPLIADWGTIPQQVTAVSATGLFVSMLGILAKIVLGKGQLINANHADIRDHYAEELAAVRKERAEDKAQSLQVERHLRGLAEDSDRRHAECEGARSEDRRDRSRMQDEIDGLKRQIVRYSAEGVLMLGEASPEVRDAAKRVKDITEGGDE